MGSQATFDLGPFEIDEEMPPPFLLNCWKHHARTILARVSATVARGEGAVRDLPRRLILVGHEIMDLYLGALSPAQIADETRELLVPRGAFEPGAFGAWIEPLGGYATLALSDRSVWVLRASPVEGRHIHVHPGRRSPHSVRVRANLQKSVIATLAWASLRGLDPGRVATVNEARRELLALSPVRSVEEDRGFGELLRRFEGIRLQEVKGRAEA
jgi:hypothetical protein